jgi:hypothetical protein
MKCGVGPKVTFHEGGKVGRSDATPIIFFSCYGHFLVKFRDNFEGSGITPSYFPILMKWSLLVLPLISLHYPEKTKQMEQILNFQVPAEGLELVILLHTQY